MQSEPVLPGLFHDRSAQDVELGSGAVLLGAFASTSDRALLGALNDVLRLSPFRHFVTPGGFTMSVAMTNCGDVGWITDRRGYR
jgi:DNA oxidative demethylase